MKGTLQYRVLLSVEPVGHQSAQTTASTISWRWVITPLEQNSMRPSDPWEPYPEVASPLLFPTAEQAYRHGRAEAKNTLRQMRQYGGSWEINLSEIQDD